MENQANVSNPVLENTVQKSFSFMLAILIAIFFCVVSGVAGYYLGKQGKSDSTLVVTASPTPPLATTPLPLNMQTLSSPTLLGLFKSLEKEGFTTDRDGSVWWISEDNWSVIVPDADSVSATKEKAYDELQDKNSPTSQIIAQVENYFSKQGFSKNERNSSSSVLDGRFYDYVLAYENGKELCTVLVNPDQSFHENEQGALIPDKNFVISCVENSNYNQAYQEQLPFLEALNTRNVAVNVKRQSSTAAIASVRARRTGYLAIFSKQSGQWKVIFQGQDVPLCSEMEKYSIPEEIHGGCWLGE